jgi:uncharacterized protein (TIRG00374 family)
VKKQLFNSLKVIVSASLLIYILVFQVDARQLFQVILDARWEFILIAMLIMVASVVLRAYRWQILLQALKIQVPLGRLVHLYFVGAFFNIFLPTGLGGDAVRMAELARTTGKGPEAVGTTLVDRATGLWVLFVLALVALPFTYTLLPAGWAPIILIGALAGVGDGLSRDPLARKEDPPARAGEVRAVLPFGFPVGLSCPGKSLPGISDL